MKVMIVDDMDVNRRLLLASLEKQGYECEAHDNAATALHSYITEDFDIVLLDIMMPIVSGEDFINIVDINRQNGKLTGPRNIIVITAMESIKEIQKLSNHESVVAVFRKPVDLDRLIALMQETVQRNNEINSN